jgi:8-oxo-dGTP diphosphatase
MVDYVLGFAFDERKEHLLLIKKTKPAWQKGFLNGIGGKIEEGETPHDSMIREFKEECDIDTIWREWKYFATMRSKSDDGFNIWCFKTFMSFDKLNNFKTTTEEVVDMYTVDGIRSQNYPLLSNIRWLVEAALDDNGGKDFELVATY